MPVCEAPCVELGSAPRTPSVGLSSPSLSDVSGTSSPELQNIRPTALFRVLAMPPPEPEQPQGQEELERRLPGYRRVVIPRELTLIELLKQSSGVTTDEEVLHIREAKLRVIPERIGLRRLNVLAPCLRTLILDGSPISTLRDLGIGLVHLKVLSVNRCGLTSLDGIWGLSKLRELIATRNQLQDLSALAAMQKLHTLNVANNPIEDLSRIWMLAVCGSLRKLTLEGTPAAEKPDYRTEIAIALPMLIYLDDRPLHNDFEDEMEGVLEDPASSSDSDEEDERPVVAKELEPVAMPDPEPSTSRQEFDGCAAEDISTDDLEPTVNKDIKPKKIIDRTRPATTECAGLRLRHLLPPRPKTAHDRQSIDSSTRLEIMNTLMARAGYEALIEAGVNLVADEIPRAPTLEDWTRFTAETGIEIDIDFNQRLDTGNALTAIERIEKIEKETAERLAKPGTFREDFTVEDRTSFMPIEDQWKRDYADGTDRTTLPSVPSTSSGFAQDMADIDELLGNTYFVHTPEESIPD